jgi:hypothetical protein
LGIKKLDVFTNCLRSETIMATPLVSSKIGGPLAS